MISYRHDGLQPFKITVKLFGKVAGAIRCDGDGFYYQPKGSKLIGPHFGTVAKVKADLEAA